MTSAANISQDNVKLFFGVILDNSEPRFKPWSSYSDTTSPPTELPVPSSNPPLPLFFFRHLSFTWPTNKPNYNVKLHLSIIKASWVLSWTRTFTSSPHWASRELTASHYSGMMVLWITPSRCLRVPGSALTPGAVPPPWRSVLECAVIWNEGVAYSINKTHNENHFVRSTFLHRNSSANGQLCRCFELSDMNSPPGSPTHFCYHKKLTASSLPVTVSGECFEFYQCVSLN